MRFAISALGEDDCSPTWEICPCCGTEFGYEDCSISVRRNRSAWIAKGLKWCNEREKPYFWNFNEQISNVPPEYMQ